MTPTVTSGVGGIAVDRGQRLGPVSLLDYLIVASLLLIQQSLFAAYATSLIPSFALQKWLLYSTPGVLLFLKTLQAPVIIRKALLRRCAKYFVFVLYGAVLALIRSDHPAGVLNSYGAVLIFMGYALAYLSQSGRSAAYHINLVRLVYVHIAFLALAHYVLWGILRVQGTLFQTYAYSGGTVGVPFSGLTLVYSAIPWYPGDVPRFGFLFMEPRVLGTQMPLALLLQIGFLRYAKKTRSRRLRRRARIQMAALLASMFIIHSTTGYLVVAVEAMFLGWMWWFGSGAKALRWTVAMCVGTYFVMAMLAIWLVFAPGMASGAADRAIQAQVGGLAQRLDNANTILGRKDPGMILGYSKAIVTSGFNLYYFPFGSGWLQPVDQERYDQYGITVTGGFSLIAALIVHAGVLGVAFFVYGAYRAVSAVKRARLPASLTSRWFAVSVVFTFLFGLIMSISGFSAGFFLKMFLLELVLIETSSHQVTPVGEVSA